MINLLLSLAVGVVVGILVTLTHLPVWAAFGPGIIAMLIAYVLLARRTSVKVQALASVAQKELSTMSPTNPRERQAKIDRAVKILESALVYDRWQFLVGSEIHAQIGMIKYMVKDYDGAAPHLAKANSRNYMAKAFHGALFFQKKDYAAMEKSFEIAVVAGKKEPIVWAVYAWCLQAMKEKDKAIAVLARAVEKNPSDEKLKNGLTALQNDKKLKMKAYEPMWWQFGLEAPPLEYSGGRRVQFQRR
jgi:tetratricopeptide (TPR) repeat protein